MSSTLDRRGFLRWVAGGLTASVAEAACGAGEADWRRVRLVSPRETTGIVRAALDDVAALLARAADLDSPVSIVEDVVPPGPLDIAVKVDAEGPGRGGGFRVAGDGGRLVITGSDEEGARNGLYAVLERLGFGFFRDGETVPSLRGPAVVDVAMEETPAFALRGDMIWNNYLGPRRSCSSMWRERDWEKALLYMARNRMNFLEFYPPLEAILALVFPDAKGLSEGSVWKSEAELDLAKRVLARGRSLGIRFMYVLGYGAFPEPVRALLPHLEWRNGFLCAHQPELREMSGRVWRRLVEELGTDHWYAVRHRGEEDQAYGDPCRSVTKKEGYLQAFSILETIDADASISVWTWGENVPELFEGFPENVRAAHVRHGMAGVFGERGEGREQSDGPPPLLRGRRWLSAQFTVFSGNEASLQTAWSDAASIARDAAVSRRDPSCEGFFQWPEWSDCSAWLAQAIASVSWNPDALSDLGTSVSRYARVRHGQAADVFLRGFLPLLSAGNARIAYPPRKRLIVPYWLAPESLSLLGRVRAGAREMAGALDSASALFHRDFVDLLAWTARRTAETFEVEAYLRHREGFRARAQTALGFAEKAWKALASVLSRVPSRSILASARALSRAAGLSARVEDSLFTMGCDFYHGYPLVLSPEAIELSYLPQLAALRVEMEHAETGGRPVALSDPGWFWHDFPDRGWAESVRRLPSEDAKSFETEMRRRLRDALASSTPPEPQELTDSVRLDAGSLEAILASVFEPTLPEPRSEPPALSGS